LTWIKPPVCWLNSSTLPQKIQPCRLQILHICCVSPSNFAFERLSLENLEKHASNKRFKTHEKFPQHFRRLTIVKATQFFSQSVSRQSFAKHLKFGQAPDKDAILPGGSKME
jgi:hypothetical protein